MKKANSLYIVSWMPDKETLMIGFLPFHVAYQEAPKLFNALTRR